MARGIEFQVTNQIFQESPRPVRPARFERATFGFEVRRSIQLSYGRSYAPLVARRDRLFSWSPPPCQDAPTPRGPSRPAVRGGLGYAATMTATTNVDTATTSLQELLRARASAKDIERHLDALSPSARLQEVLAITGRGVKHLYEAVADAPSLTLEEIVPANAGSSTVIFEGRNSLPLFT